LHPGGANIILHTAGRDATINYDLYHPRELAEQTLPPTAYLGDVDLSTIPKAEPNSSLPIKEVKDVALPPLESLISLDDFERVAEQYLPPNAWAIYSSAADDGLSKEQNRRVFQKVYLRPRILRDVQAVKAATTILGEPCSLPVFVSPVAMAKLAHPSGECAVAAAVGHEGIVQVISTSSSMPLESIVAARIRDDQPQFFQLYVYRDIEKSKMLIKRAERAGVKAIWVTVDSPVMGKREMDKRVKLTTQVGTMDLGDVALI
jgi:L-lactate dehydrogenase (cytochrome)